MIRIHSESGKLLRVIDTDNEQVLFTKTYGFVTPSSLNQRVKLRKGSGLKERHVKPDFAFKVISGGLESQAGCETFKESAINWTLKTDHQLYKIDFVEKETELALPFLESKEQKRESGIWWQAPLIASIILLLSSIGFFHKSTNSEEAKQAETAPVVVTLDKPKTVEPITRPPPEPKVQKNQALDKNAIAKKALTQNLGFLKLLGRKDLKKAMGGLPTNVPEASAGAGPGGNEGSGGELLVGLGKGLRKTTVGNSGLAGLGGIGTKGAGGGLGGYGETDLGSGAGQSISAIPLAQDAKVEGGLDRSLIQATIMRYLSQVRACYEEGLKRRADMLGQVTMDFEINGQGGVNFSHVLRSSLSDRDVESCISNRMLTWKFPTPRGGVNVKVNYPFMLRPVRS